MASPSPPDRLLARAARLSLRDWGDVLRAIRWLAIGHQIVARQTGGRIVTEGQSLAGGVDAALAGRIAAAIPRAAARVPWRSDCLVQALAAQRWLAARGLGSELRIGVRLDGPRGFDAHAWLIHDGITITGGDVSTYRPFATPAR